MTMNSLLYAVVVREMFPDIIILETFWKRLRNTHGYPKISSAQKKTNQSNEQTKTKTQTLEKTYKLKISLFIHKYLLP